jgi:hypothetical protein
MADDQVAGYIRRGFPEMAVTFNGLAPGQNQTIILLDRVPVIEWAEVTLLLRVHSHNLASGAGVITVGAYAESISADEPGTTFLDQATFAAVALSQTTPSPTYFAVPIMTGGLTAGGLASMPALVQIVASGAQFSSGTILSATLSAQLSVKDGC